MNISSFARDASGLLGCGLMSYGAWSIYEPVGYLLGGLLLVVLAIVGGRT